jgi:hypothetical protein
MNDDMKSIMAQIDESSALEKKYQELRANKIELDTRRVPYDLNKLKQDEKDLEIARNANFGQMTDVQLDELIRVNDEYIEAARNKMVFIDPIFDKVVPFFKKNIILVGAKTGDGKSTTVANIVRSTISQKNKITGKHKRVLVITNEERAEDFYNRITCLIKGWHYTNHDRFTDEQRDEFRKYIKFLGGSGLVTVVDNNYGGSAGVTTSKEGLKTIFDNLIANEQYYDVVLIDYYQNFKHSKENPKLTEWDVQQGVSAILDDVKNRYPAPIVLLCQIDPNKKDENIPFQYRVKGRKVISDVATLIIELIADRENLRTEWVVHKSRFTEGVVGHSFYTGYDKGQYVSYDKEFQDKVALIQQKRQQEMMNKMAGESLNRQVGNEKDNKD